MYWPMCSKAIRTGHLESAGLLPMKVRAYDVFCGESLKKQHQFAAVTAHLQPWCITVATLHHRVVASRAAPIRADTHGSTGALSLGRSGTRLLP
jgi:hypothetical protein